MTGIAREPLYLRVSVVPARTSRGEDAVFNGGRDGEATLIQSLRAGGESAFRQLVERYQHRVYSLAYRLLRDPSGADEIAQTVFARIHFNLSRPARHGSLLFWIYEITVNECFRQFRERQRFDGSERSMASGGRALAVELLTRIPRRNRTLLILREAEGYSIEDLSRMTGLSRAEVNVRLFRGRQIMAGTKRFSLRVMLTRLAGRLGAVE